MDLDWVEVECPSCGIIGERARADGEETETPRYVKCPRCRARDGDPQLPGHRIVRTVAIYSLDEEDENPAIAAAALGAAAILGTAIVLGAVLGSIIRRRI